MGPGTVIVLTDMAIVKDLMDKHSQATVDRPPMHFADRIAGGMNMILARYSKYILLVHLNPVYHGVQMRTGERYGACPMSFSLQTPARSILRFSAPSPRSCYMNAFLIRRYIAPIQVIFINTLIDTLGP
jgi:hypothetical protein